MNKLQNITLLLLIIALLALPILVQAQEDSGAATTALSEKDLLFAAVSLIVLLGLVLQSFWLYKSIPPELAQKLFSETKALAKETKTPLDDMLVEGAEMAYNASQDKPATLHNPSESRD